MARGVDELRELLSDAIGHSRSLLEHGRKYASRLKSYFSRLFDDLDRQREATVARLSVPARAEWNESIWSSWVPSGTLEERLIRIGRLVEQRRSEHGWELPAFAPFLGQSRTVIIRTPPHLADAGKSLLQSLVMRTALLLPYRARYTLLDPAGAGAAFPMRRHLAPYVRENTSHVDRDMRGVSDDIRRVIETYLDATTDSFEKLPPEIRANERYQFVFAADFPNEYDREAIGELIGIGNKGPRAGVYLFVHHNTAYPLPRDLSLDQFKSAAVIDLGDEHGHGYAGYSFTPDQAPAPDLQRQLFDTLTRNRPPELVVEWDKAIGLQQTDWWKGSSVARISTPVGAKGGSGTLDLYFGIDAEGRPCVHGLLAAMPGAGKSSLYHTLILSLSIRYSPRELRLYLIDGKNGVEFQPYRHLPHAEVVALQTQPELARAVLADLLSEMSRRNELFQKQKVADFQSYRNATADPLPRILLIVDEYQELFEGDQEGWASDVLRKLSAMGRSAGIHLLLGSQKFTATGMEHREAILDNFHLRIGMQMQRDAIEALTEFGRRGKSLLLACDTPGKVVLNDRGGDDSANGFGKVAYLKPERRDQLLTTLTAYADRLKPTDLPRRAVFNGRRQPALLENPQLTALLDYPSWPSANDLERFARAPRNRRAGAGSLVRCRATAGRVARANLQRSRASSARSETKRWGERDPRRRQQCRPVWDARFACRERRADLGPAETEFELLDRSVPGSQWSAALRQAEESVLRPCGFRSRLTRQTDEIERACDELVAEVQRRRQLREEERALCPTKLVVLTEADTLDHFRRLPGQYGLTDAPGTKALARLLTDGPPLGIHVILSFARLAQMRQVLDPRSQLPLVSHRIALQMAEVDSHDLIGDRSAARLQSEGPTPLCAVYRDTQAGTASVRFKPYTTEPQGDAAEDALLEQIRIIGERIQARQA